MSRDGSGNASVPYPDFVNGTTADADQVDANFSSIVSDLTNSIAADGQTTPTANLKMGGFKHTGVANASADTEYAAWGQVKNNIDSNVAQSGSIVWGGTAGGTADALTLTLSPALTAYAAGNSFTFIAASDNTGAATVDINGLGTKALQFDGAALTGGEIVTGKLYQIDYDGTQFQVTRVSGYVDNSVTLNKLDDTGTDGYVLTAKGAGVDPEWNALPSQNQSLIIQDQKAQNTDGGTFTTGAWRTRDLNTILVNNISGASLLSNQITLPAGNYEVEWSAPANSRSNELSLHQSKLYDTTGLSDLVLGSSMELIEGASGSRVSNNSVGMGYFTLGVQSVIELQHQCSSNAVTTGFGKAANFGIEVYSQIRINKV